MKTSLYNPSMIEVAFANAIVDLKSELEAKLNMEITSMTSNTKKDNPDVVIMLKDSDGDAHELVVSSVQRPDK